MYNNLCTVPYLQTLSTTHAQCRAMCVQQREWLKKLHKNTLRSNCRNSLTCGGSVLYLCKTTSRTVASTGCLKSTSYNANEPYIWLTLSSYAYMLIFYRLAS